MIIHSKRIAICICINIILFGGVLYLGNPIYNSGDDVFCLYQLAGGFGFEPTELVDYNYVLNPLLNIVVKNLFVIYPDINWYTWMLIVFHYIATTIILILITREKANWKILLIYGALFLVFEAQFLLGLSFTNTSIILTSAGILLLLSIQNKQSLLYELLCIGAFVFASLFRVYTLFPFVVLVLPFLFLYKKTMLPKFARITIVGSILIILLNQYHQSYYKRNIPNWAEKEQYRQILYKYFNHDGVYNIHISGRETEIALIKYALLFDTVYLNSRKLKSIYKEISKKKSSNFEVFNVDTLKWFLINNRIYFFSILILIAFYTTERRVKITSLATCGLLGAEVLFLAMYMKLPGYILPGGAGLICWIILFYSKDDLKEEEPKFAILKLFLSFLLLFWATVRVYKVSKINKQYNIYFTNMAEEIIRNNNYLFVVQDNGFATDYFYVFDSPSKYKLKNILQGWQNSDDVNIKIMRSYKINNVADIPGSNDVLIWGKPVQALLNYFETTTGKKYCFSEPLKEFKYAEVRRLEECK
ncbi:MAG: hypothetical protein QM763_04310 [Agriterribacter sp.]